MGRGQGREGEGRVKAECDVSTVDQVPFLICSASHFTATTYSLLCSNMPHSRTVSEVSEPEFIISFNENVYSATMNADILTEPYVRQARSITADLETKDER